MHLEQFGFKHRKLQDRRKFFNGKTRHCGQVSKILCTTEAVKDIWRTCPLYFLDETSISLFIKITVINNKCVVCACVCREQYSEKRELTFQ